MLHTIHPMLSQADKIVERGLVVFDDIRTIPLYNEPFVTDMMTVCISLSGWFKGECDMRPITFGAHEAAVILSHHMLCAHESSDDYRAILIVLAPAFQQEMKHQYPDVYRDLQHYHYRQDVPLNEAQFARIVDIALLLRDIGRDDSPQRTRLLGNMLEVLFTHLRDYRRTNGVEDHMPTMHEELFSNFYHAIEQHYSESREVQFYASLFNLSPKHFSAVIKQQTGIGALEWIHSYVVIQAKALLRHQQMTVQQIALRLGFSDQAAFSRYFKNNTGHAPTEYREMA